MRLQQSAIPQELTRCQCPLSSGLAALPQPWLSPGQQSDESNWRRDSPRVYSGASPKGTDRPEAGPATWPSGRKVEGSLWWECGRAVRGLWLQLSHLPREPVLTSGRPGSKHSGISMETAVQD